MHQTDYCTTRVTAVVALVPAEVAVTVTEYVPAVVPGVGVGGGVVVPLLPPPPQAKRALENATSNSRLPAITLQPRRRALKPTSKMPARAVSPMGYQGAPGRAAGRSAPVVGAVVDTVRVAVAGPAAVMLTGLLVPKLNVGRYCAPEGLDARVAVRVTLPVNPPAGVTVTVEVFPAVVPGALMVTAVPPTVNDGGGGGGAVTTTEVVADAER